MTASGWQRRAVLVAAVAGLLVALLPAAAGASGSAEGAMVARINAERAAHGLPALATDGELTEVARAWTGRMIAAGGISHRPDLRAGITGDPELVGENVGRSHLPGATEDDLVGELHRAFMASPGHRANVLGDWTHVGVGVGLSRDGQEMWVTVNFTRVRTATPAPAPDEGDGFTAAAVDEAAPEAAEPTATPGGDRARPAPDADDPAEEPADAPVTRLAPFASLGPKVRAHFALHEPPLLPRHFAGYVTAV